MSRASQYQRFGTTSGSLAPGSLGLAIQQAGGNLQQARAIMDAQAAGFATPEAQAVNRMARNQFEAKATAAGMSLSDAYATIGTDLTSTPGIVDAINRLPGPKTTTTTTGTDNGGGGGGGGTTTGTGETKKDEPDYGKIFSDAIAGLTSTLGAQLTDITNQFGAFQTESQNQMNALRQSMLESQVRSYDRDTVAGVKTATGSGGDAMQIARRGTKGAFGRSGLRISSLNV